MWRLVIEIHSPIKYVVTCTGKDFNNNVGVMSKQNRILIFGKYVYIEENSYITVNLQYMCVVSCITKLIICVHPYVESNNENVEF